MRDNQGLMVKIPVYVDFIVVFLVVSIGNTDVDTDK